LVILNADKYTVSHPEKLDKATRSVSKGHVDRDGKHDSHDHDAQMKKSEKYERPKMKVKTQGSQERLRKELSPRDIEKKKKEKNHFFGTTLNTSSNKLTQMMRPSSDTDSPSSSEGSDNDGEEKFKFKGHSYLLRRKRSPRTTTESSTSSSDVESSDSDNELLPSNRSNPKKYRNARKKQNDKKRRAKSVSKGSHLVLFETPEESESDTDGSSSDSNEKFKRKPKKNAKLTQTQNKIRQERKETKSKGSQLSPNPVRAAKKGNLSAPPSKKRIPEIDEEEEGVLTPRQLHHLKMEKRLIEDREISIKYIKTDLKNEILKEDQPLDLKRSFVEIERPVFPLGEMGQCTFVFVLHEGESKDFVSIQHRLQKAWNGIDLPGGSGKQGIIKRDKPNK